MLNPATFISPANLGFSSQASTFVIAAKLIKISGAVILINSLRATWFLMSSCIPS